MAKQPTITTISSGYYSTETLTSNFEAIQAFFDNVVSRDGSSPNTMLGDLDMNSNDIINVGAIDVGTLTIDGVDVTSVINNPLNALSPSDGDILYWNSDAWNLLSVGTDGQVLKLSSGLPAWGTDNDTDTDTVGVTVEEDDSSVQTEVTVINFVTNGAGIVTSPSAGTVEVDLDTFVNG